MFLSITGLFIYIRNYESTVTWSCEIRLPRSGKIVIVICAHVQSIITYSVCSVLLYSLRAAAPQILVGRSL